METRSPAKPMSLWVQTACGADLVVFKLDDLAFAGSHDPIAALLLCNAQRADRVMIAGTWRVTDGAIVDLDLDALKAEQRQHARDLVAQND